MKWNVEVLVLSQHGVCFINHQLVATFSLGNSWKVNWKQMAQHLMLKFWVKFLCVELLHASCSYYYLLYYSGNRFNFLNLKCVKVYNIFYCLHWLGYIIYFFVKDLFLPDLSVFYMLVKRYHQHKVTNVILHFMTSSHTKLWNNGVNEFSIVHKIV